MNTNTIYTAEVEVKNQVNILVLKKRIKNEEIKKLTGANTLRQIDIRPWADVYLKSVQELKQSEISKMPTWPFPEVNPNDLSVYELNGESISMSLHLKFDHLIDNAFKCDEDFLEKISDIRNFQNDDTGENEEYCISKFREVLNNQW